MPMFKIRNVKTGEFSSGGAGFSWSKNGKTWSAAGWCRNSLRMQVPRGSSKVFAKEKLAGIEVVEYDQYDVKVWDAYKFMLKEGEPRVTSEFVPAAVKPKLGVIAVVFNSDWTHVLMGQRQTTTGPQWEFPGGKVESFETLVEAARRETLEETGLTVEVVTKPLQVSEYIDSVKNRHFACVVFECNLIAGEPRAEVRADGTGHDWVWVPVGEIPRPLYFDSVDVSIFGGAMSPEVRA